MAQGNEKTGIEVLEEIFQCFVCMEPPRNAHLCSMCCKIACFDCIRTCLIYRPCCPVCQGFLTVTKLIKCGWMEDVTRAIDSIEVALAIKAVEDQVAAEGNEADVVASTSNILSRFDIATPDYKRCPLTSAFLCKAQANIVHLDRHLARKHPSLWLPSGKVTLNVVQLIGKEYKFLIANGDEYILVKIYRSEIDNFGGSPLRFSAFSLTNCSLLFRCTMVFSKLEYDMETDDTQVQINFLCSPCESEWTDPPLLPIHALCPLLEQGKVHVKIFATEEEGQRQSACQC